MNFHHIFVEHRNNLYAMFALTILNLIIFVPILYHQMWEGGSDFASHIQFALEMFEEKTITVPHFLYHFMVIGQYFFLKSFSSSFIPLQFQQKGLLGQFEYSGLLIAILSTIFLSFVLYLFIQSILKFKTKKGLWISIGLVLCLTFVSPIHIFSIQSKNLYLGYIGINIYASSTMRILKPLALLLFLLVLKMIKSGSSLYQAKGQIGLLPLLSTLTLLAKPSYAICLLPATLLFMTYATIKKNNLNWIPILLGFFLPSIFLLLWQYCLTYILDTVYETHIIFAPLKVIKHYSSWIFPKFLLSFLFPVFVYVSYFKRARQNAMLNLAWLAFLFGAFYQYFLAEEGPYIHAANFYWSAQITLFILFVISLVFLMKQKLFINSKRAFIIFTINLLIFSLHTLCGIFWYFVQLTSSPIDQWW